MSAGELEMLTLLGNPEQAKRKCFFDSEDEILLFLQSMGISQDSVRKLEHTRKQEGYVMKELICPNPLGNTFLLQYHWYGNHGMVTTFFQMGETTEDPPFSPGYVSLRQLGNSNRILRLEYLKNCAEEGIRVFKEKAPRNKKEAEKRQRILERRFKYQLNRFKPTPAEEVSLATIQAKMEDAYSQRRNEKIVVQKIQDTPVEVVARDELSGATIYSGDFGAVSSPKQKREMKEMMKKKEEDRSSGRQDTMVSGEDVREKLNNGEVQPHEQWREEKKKKEKNSCRSVNEMLKAVAARNNPFPKKPIKKGQSYGVRKYWLHKKYKIWRWRTQMTNVESMKEMKESRSQGLVTIQDQKDACKSMTGSRARKMRENLNSKATSAIEIDAILEINRKLSEVFPESVMEVSLLKKLTVLADRDDLLSGERQVGSDMLVTPPANVTADARGVGTVLSKLITHFLASTHILFVDACHDEDTWVTMVACFLDGNHHIQPVGFYVCESERESYWKTFLQMIHMAGLTQETSSELVVISDQDKGIEEAVSDVFSWCEHTPCGVHRERHFQKEWQVAHGKLSKNDIVAAGVLNKMVSLYREAVKATTKEECEMLLNEAEKLEFEYSLQHDCDPVGGVETCYNMNRMTHLARYMKDTKGVWMWEFKFNHLMETTSNAVESCMRWLQIDLFGLGIPRNANLFNRYRLLVMWMMTCDKDRSLKLKGNFKVVQTARGVKEISDWAIGKMVENGHFVETYGEWHVVQRGSEMDCGVGTIEWNGEVTDEDVGDGNFYRVIDKKTRRVYMVNLENWMNPCSCHVTRWLKVPCVHVMMVLKALQSPDMVWCFFGKEYTVEMIQLTCAQWTEQERTLFKWMESIRFTGEEKDNKIVTRETAKGNGTTAKRKTGVWEKLKTS